MCHIFHSKSERVFLLKQVKSIANPLLRISKILKFLLNNKIKEYENINNTSKCNMYSELLF